MRKLALAATLFVCLIPAQGATVFVANGANGSEPALGTATFTLGDGTIIIELTADVINPTSIASNLSDISFQVFNGDTLLIGTAQLTGASGTVRSITGNGAGEYSDSPISGVANIGWVLDPTAAALGTYHIDVLSGAGHAGPEHTLVGSPDANNAYSNANASILNATHQPTLGGTLTFVLSLSGVTEGSVISNVVFSFGTNGGTVPGGCEGEDCGGGGGGQEVPEPGSFLLLGGGLAALALFRRRI